MSFLQPTLLLLALPVIALPIIIHLINQRRYQTVKWAAMMFLLAANRMSRGYARIRQWLILAFRMLAIAGLAFVLGRPLAGGWLGMTAGARPDATILILDRSPSMQQAGAGSGFTKLEAGRRQLVQTMKTLGQSRWVLIDGSSSKPRELDSPDALLNLPEAGPSGASSDLPAMLQAARDYIEANRAGQTDVWICSDLRENDWDPDGGRWQTIRDAFLEFAQRTRFHLLAYPQPAPADLSVRVTGVKRLETGDAAELLVSLRVAREGVSDARVVVPVQFEIDGARSEVAVELTGRDAELKDHRLPLEKGRGRGWGKVSIPADANPADNAYWFAFDKPKPRMAVVVAENPDAARPLQLAASIAPDPALECSAEIIAVEQLPGVEWEKLGLLLWQAPLPEGDSAKRVQAFLERGGRVIFFPPKAATADSFLGVKWKAWTESQQDIPIDSWRGDQDLLAPTQSGSPLPVGQLGVRRYCGLEGETTPLATLKGGASLLARVATSRGGAYFCSTTANGTDSTLATGGVVLYVLIQRALADGALVLEDTRQLTAGDPSGDDPRQWKRLAGLDEVLSTDYAAQPGVYASGNRLLAVNRSLAEDLAPVLGAPRVAGLFKGLDFSRVDDSADNASSLIQEIWRLFLLSMMVAMVVEAGLCLPKPARQVVGGRA
jgi:Aerotolerance regulator N-terminal